MAALVNDKVVGLDTPQQEHTGWGFHGHNLTICPSQAHTYSKFTFMLCPHSQPEYSPKQLPFSGTSFSSPGLGAECLVSTVLKTAINVAQAFSSAGLEERAGGAGK